MNKRSGFTLLEVALSLPLLLLVLWNTNRIAEAIASGIEQQREAEHIASQLDNWMVSMLLAEPDDELRQIGSHQLELTGPVFSDWRVQWQVDSGLPTMALGSLQKGGIEQLNWGTALPYQGQMQCFFYLSSPA